MVIWRVEGNEIGANGNGAAYFETKAEALKCLRDHVRYCKENGDEAGIITADPVKMEIRNRSELCEALNDAMGFGCS